MKISILTTGTRGDTQPYIALGKELKSLGYEVKLAAFENYGKLVEDHGLHFHPIKGDIAKISREMSKSSIESDNPIKFFTSFQKMKPYIKDKQLGMQRDLFEACEGADAIIYHPGAAIGEFAGEHFGVPAILASPFPMAPTREYPALIFYQLRWGKTANLLTHKLFEKGFWLTVKPPIVTFWKERFGKLPPHFNNPFGKAETNNHTSIMSISPHVFPQPEGQMKSFGYWFLDEDLGEWSPPADLVEFLEKGDEPVYVGFGSIYDESPEDTTKLVVEALRKSGKRGIIGMGWNHVDDKDEYEDMFFIESIPHTWLFPKVSGVIHHGGAGTTATAFRSGVPSVVIPHGNDQFAWGKRTEELGVGSTPIPRKKLTVDNLSKAIGHIQSSPVKEAAQELGKQVQQEHGARDTARYIQHFLKG
ncbi:glycosyltransferase [Rossellomorea sp. KS-H15a]|uniref:glycosyltransferase n=1 Tax=Rossellomorea sp. KS-H15a TaxID=2963940 RepID=UPI0020C5B418|nr:glycosyltransferase [Rossellomorea sp. KS-H15a]UTE76784.1 glycosyltransferase [Rossellomorea sp. KS-H15a]